MNPPRYLKPRVRPLVPAVQPLRETLKGPGTLRQLTEQAAAGGNSEATGEADDDVVDAEIIDEDDAK